MQHLLDLLHFRGQALGQFVLVASILCAFSMSGVVAMIAAHERAKLRSAVFVLLVLASLSFILATLVSVMILPFMNEHVQLTERAVRGLLFLYSVVVFAIILGTLLLSAGLAAAGYMVSVRVGRLTLTAVLVAGAVYLLCVLSLVSDMR
jgi:hypothetical protein